MGCSLWRWPYFSGSSTSVRSGRHWDGGGRSSAFLPSPPWGSRWPFRPYPQRFRVEFNLLRRLLRDGEQRASLMVETIQWTDDGVVMIDQTRLPREEAYVTCRTYGEVADAIRSMVIRGAPAIGVAAAMG